MSLSLSVCVSCARHLPHTGSSTRSLNCQTALERTTYLSLQHLGVDGRHLVVEVEVGNLCMRRSLWRTAEFAAMINMCFLARTWTHTCIRKQIHTCIHTHTCRHTHIHAYTHTYIHAGMQSSVSHTYYIVKHTRSRILTPAHILTCHQLTALSRMAMKVAASNELPRLRLVLCFAGSEVE